MSRPALEVADILRASGDSFIDRNESHIAWPQLKVMRAIRRCRTAALGGHRDRCSGCGQDLGLSYNSCRNRHCPKCQGQARHQWIARRTGDLVPLGYFHVVFTVPHQLSALILQNKRALYSLLFQASSETMTELAGEPERLGAEIGFLGALHTWGQTLEHHPHVHYVVPEGGFTPDRSAWIRPKYRFFLPVEALSEKFRGKFIDGLKNLFRRRKLRFHGSLRLLAEPRVFAQFLRTLHRHDWVVYAKKPFGGPEHVLRYLAQYTHRVAISNHRLVNFEDGKVAFRWRDYAHGDKKRKMTLTAHEFIRRFLLHVLPRGFVRIRHFGWMANRCRRRLAALCRWLLQADPLPTTSPPTPSRTCPRCGGAVIVEEKFTPQQLWRLAQQRKYVEDSS
ncbi:MAG: IS91 family transposase [Verrucomicrobiota bacterium]|jgi:hypothetical protein